MLFSFALIIKMLLFLSFVLNAILLIKLLLLAKLDFALLVDISILKFGLINFLKNFLMSLIDICFLPFQKNVDLSFVMIENYFILSLGVKHILDYQFQQKHKKALRKKKIGKYSKKYFTNSDILHYGLITVIHTFGRDLKWNPHIHALVSLGGFTKQWKWKKFDYFSIDAIANQWKYIVLHAIQSGNYRNPKQKKQAQEVVNLLYKQDARLFFHVGKQEVNNPEGLLKYLGRYLARSPIANYKITKVTDTHVTFFFHDLKNEKQKTYLTLSREEFLQQVLIHFPPKHFKMISRFGFYARRKSETLIIHMLFLQKSKKKVFFSFYVQSMIKTFQQHPFLCPYCHIPMKKKELYISIRWYGRRIHILYS